MTFENAQKEIKRLIDLLDKAPTKEDTKKMRDVENKLRNETSLTMFFGVAIITAVIFFIMTKNNFIFEGGITLPNIGRILLLTLLPSTLTYLFFNAYISYDGLAKMINTEYKVLAEKYNSKNKSKDDYQIEIRDVLEKIDILNIEAKKNNYLDASLIILEPNESEKKGYKVSLILRYYLNINVQTGEPSYKTKTVNILSNYYPNTEIHSNSLINVGV